MQGLSEQLKGKMFLSPMEVVGVLGISKSTVYRLKDIGALPFYEFAGCIKFKVDDLESYIAGCRKILRKE